MHENIILKAPVNIDKVFFYHCSVLRTGDISYHILYKYLKITVLLQQQMILRQRKVGVTFQLLYRLHSLSTCFFLWMLKAVV